MPNDKGRLIRTAIHPITVTVFLVMTVDNNQDEMSQSLSFFLTGNRCGQTAHLVSRPKRKSLVLISIAADLVQRTGVTMNAIERLMKEHRQIENVLSALEQFCDGLSAEGEDQKDRLRQIVEFLAGFADTIHHGKEEQLLFTKMYDYGFSKESGPVAVMLFEHDQGRNQIGIMRRIAEQEKSWSADDCTEITNAGQSYVSLLRGHIQKEDNILYQMAKTALPLDVMSKLDDACEEFDDTHFDEIARLNTLAVTLC